jgi:diguanylate cyclase (GGDEF)-like protein
MNDSASAREINRYLDAIVDLTRHHDTQGLITSLLSSVCQSISAQRVRLFSIFNDRRDTEFNKQNLAGAVVQDLYDLDLAKRWPLEKDPDLLACVQTQQVISRERVTGRRVVFPVFGARDVRALLVVEDLRDGSASYELIAKLLRVYSNQVAMLSRSELDPLTGLYNRQSFFERIRRLGQRGGPQRRTADDSRANGNCFALFDIDHFKHINDRYGHLYGDEVLLLFARQMTQAFRAEDPLFRYGGEEFAVVLVDMDLEGAARVLERFRNTVASYDFPQIGRVTVSIGFTANNVEEGIDKVVMCADQALYYAKHNGRNQVCCYETLVAEGKLKPVTVAAGDIELF